MSNIVLTIGTFDIPHLGHYSFLQKIHELFPDRLLVVSINTDEFIEQFKGKRPVFNYDERLQLIKKINFVYEVWENEGCEDSKKTIHKINMYHKNSPVDVIAIGSDWARKDYYKQMSFTQDYLDYNGISLIYIPYTQGISTSEIKKRL